MASTNIPETTRAIQVLQHGGVEVITLNTIPTPTPADDQLLIKVEYGGVNFIDTYHRSGVYPQKSFPFTLGVEAAGTVVKLPTSKSVLDDPNYQKRAFQLGSKVVLIGQGAFQEYIVGPWSKVSVLPSPISTLTGAAGVLQGLTALTFVTEAYPVQPGDWILVHAAAGGFGLLLTQIVKARGGHVIGATSTDEKAKVAKAAGADEVVVYTKEGDEGSILKRVQAVTGGEGVHAIYDGVGKDTWEDNFEFIRRKGTIVSVGNASGVVPPFSPLKLSAKNVKLLRPTLFNYLVTPDEVHRYSTELWQLIEQGKVNIKIHKQYPFTAEGVAQSQTDLAGKGTTGKLVINIT